jgi:hypothetical protein
VKSDREESVGSVTVLLREAKLGKADAFEQLFQFYFGQLLQIAQHRLGSSGNRRVADEEDLAIQVLATFFVDLQDGKDVPIVSRTDVLRMLSRRLQQRAANQKRDAMREKRGEGKVSGESVFRDGMGQFDPAGINQIADPKAADPRGDDPLQVFGLFHQRLLDSLNDPLTRSIASMWLAGDSAEKIVSESGRSRPTVYRKLKLIRETWQAAALDGGVF